MIALLPELGDLAPSGTMPAGGGDPTTERFRLFDSMSTFLRNMADTEPLVVVLEDLQAADVPTLLLLEFVTSQMAEAAILILATFRDVELTPEHPLTATLAELHRSPVTTQLVLGGLDADEVARFLEAMAGREAASTLSTTLHHQTGGNPLFLGEAVRLIAASTSESASSALARIMIPAEIRAVIERRLEGLSSETTGLLETLSVLGNEFDIEVAAKMADLDVGVLLDRLGEAVAAGLVIDSRGGPGTFGFAHDLIRQTLYASLSPAIRVRLHRHAAGVLEEAYAEDEDEHLTEVALHHFEAAAGGSHEKAVEYGRRAGEQALRGLAFEEAARLFEVAVQMLETSDRPDRASLGYLLLALGDARVGAGDLQGAGRAFRRAAEAGRRVGDVRLLARAAIGYGGRFIWSRAGNDTAMVPLLQDALVMLGGEDDKLRARLLSRLACATRSSPDREHSSALARQGVELARQLDDPPTLAYALTGLLGAIWWPENPEERLQLGLELVQVGVSAGGVEGEVDGHMASLAALAELGDFAAARMELRLLSQAGGSLPIAAQRWLEGALTQLARALRRRLRRSREVDRRGDAPTFAHARS
jgi:hypothetical protein